MVKFQNKNMNKLISAFSLFEACVVMLIVAIFVAMCANAYTKRHVTYQESDGHGRYECYRTAGGMLAQRYVENNSARDVSGATCVFRPPRYAKYILINAIGGGSATDAGGFSSSFFSSIDAPLIVAPGGPNGSTTVTKNGDTIVSVSSGSGNMVVTSPNVNSVSSCQVSNGFKSSTASVGPPYNCGATPTCAQDGTNIIVYYCKSATDFTSIEIPITDLKANMISSSGNSITYYDLQDYFNVGHLTSEAALDLLRRGERPYHSYFTLNVEFDMTTSPNSEMEQYLKILGISDGIATIHPGAPDKPGGVVILW